MVRPYAGFSPWAPAVAGSLALAMMSIIAFRHPNALGETFGHAVAASGFAIVVIGLFPFAAAITFFALAIIGDRSSETAASSRERTGIALFIFSEAVLFASLFAVYFYSWARSSGGWPPPGIAAPDPWGAAIVNTAVLLASGVAAVVAHHCFLSARPAAAEIALAASIALGLWFLASQVREFVYAPFAYDDGAYASIFFLGTGFHGAHVFVGVVLLAVALLRLRAGHFTLKSQFGLEAPIWYWHFVDIVWLFLFSIFYW
jgi:cytochrome c oxidase subunit 3